MAGLQPPTLQRVFAFQVHSGEFVQIIHVSNNHWCVVSTVGCQSGVVRVYDSMYNTLSKETVHFIARMVHVPSSDLKVVMMDVEKQSNSSDCGVLAIATYAVVGTLAVSGLTTVRSGHIWPLVLRIARFLVSLYWVTERVSRESQRQWSSTVHVVCRKRKVMRWPCVIPATSGITATAWTFPVRYLGSPRSTGSAKGV